jgi:general secretion pathway protein F
MSALDSGNATAPALTDFILLNEEIAAIVRARLPLESHLAKIGAELPGKAGDLAGRVGRRLQAGENVVQAIDAECGSMPPAYRATVLAGLESGQLAGAVESLVDSASRIDQLRRITGIAILYPLAILVVASVLLPLVITKVLPQLEGLNFRQFGPIAWLSHRPAVVRAAALGLPCLSVLAAAIWWRRSGRVNGVRAPRFGLVTWLPGARRVQRWSQAATFAELLRLMVEQGVPLERALRLAGESANDARLRDAALGLSEHLQRGGTAKPGKPGTQHAAPGFPLLLRLSLSYAENRALFTSSLTQAATIYRERAIHAAEWYAEYVPIILTVAIGGTLTIGFTLLVLWPYTSMLHELSASNWK